MEVNRKIKVGIGFVTGRKSFQKILKTYIYSWRECGLTEKEDVQLDLFVAYDLKYSNTKISDYTKINRDLLDLINGTYFIGKSSFEGEMADLVDKNVILKKEANLFTGGGYASKRNAVLYAALKNGIDYLVFLDDDEYPMAVTKTRSSAIWSGQHVLSVHLKHITQADITNGYHCGYISPIPYLEFNEVMTETDFRTFIEAISNDIINWETIRSVMKNGGVTYADTRVLINEEAEEVEEVNHAKFITGGNLCINLKDPNRVCPFYNPPGARGEDTFLSTCLSGHKVVRVPCYTFHDGFSTYHHLMDGVLPINLKYIKADNEGIISRFYRACIGWIRYKPLFLYIADRDHYTQNIEIMREKLDAVLPKVCAYFGREDFMNIRTELDRHDRNVIKHYLQFAETQHAWGKIVRYLAGTDEKKTADLLGLKI